MKKAKTPKSKIATIMMFVCLVIFVVLFIVFFNVADGYKTEYSAMSIKLVANTTALADKLQIRTDMSRVNQFYQLFAFLSYACSILVIASLGLGLAISDKLKEIEDEGKEERRKRLAAVKATKRRIREERKAQRKASRA